MNIRKLCYFASALLLIFCQGVEASLPDIDQAKTKKKIEEIMSSHATHKEVSPLIIERSLSNFLDELDPTKTYFIRDEIAVWLEPSDALKDQIQEDYDKGSFCEFSKIHEQMTKAIERRRQMEISVEEMPLPEKVNPEEFKDIEWVTSEEELQERLLKMKSLQIDAMGKVMKEPDEKVLQRIQKRQRLYEEKILQKEPCDQQRYTLSRVLKAFSSALDSQTAYFTPDEANQFIISVQQRLFGIGAQLRDDISGFTVVKLVEGGPAALGKELKAKDRIIAIDGEPVIGWEISDAVELIRGEEGTDVTLTVVREIEEEGKEPTDETLDLTITRGEVVLTESRYEIDHEPYGDGVIAYLRLFSFYQDQDSSSAKDLAREFNKLKEEHNVLAVILDLRYNPGGILNQAVEVAGLFITKGIVVSVKDENGKVQHLRDIDGETVWNGPLTVMINRMSASASEIVAQTLQDYGRALVIGDEHSYGKGSFQTFTLNAGGKGTVNPEGEYKVTRGRYYTVSGKSPQLVGVFSDIVVPGALSESDLGETASKYPLETDEIEDNFKDDLSDIPFFQRRRIAASYMKDLQKKLNIYGPFLPLLKKNSSFRIEHNTNYQNFLKELTKKDKEIEEEPEDFGHNDLQLIETYNIMKDLVMMILVQDQIDVQFQEKQENTLEFFQEPDETALLKTAE